MLLLGKDKSDTVFKTFCDLNLTLNFLSMTFLFMQHLSQTHTSTLNKFELFEARLGNPWAQKVKMVLFNLDLTLN